MSDEEYVRQALGCLGWTLLVAIVLVGSVVYYLYNLKMM